MTQRCTASRMEPDWCSPSTSSRRWSTTPATGAGSRPPTHSVMCTRWAGSPRLALNVAGWPVDELPLELLAEVLAGARQIVIEAGAAVVGRHTITTEREPLFGMVALGFVEVDAIVRNSTARPGMHLYLSKPIGTGLITTAIKRGQTDEDVARLAVNTMTALNADASAAMVSAGVGAGTDVTGFGLLGHLRKMLDASGCAAIVNAGSGAAPPDGARPCQTRHRRRRDQAQPRVAAGGHRVGRAHTARTDRVGRRADEWRTPGGFGSEPVHGPVHRDRRGRAGSDRGRSP
mgnify:CR=1 FL=1